MTSLIKRGLGRGTITKITISDVDWNSTIKQVWFKVELNNLKFKQVTHKTNFSVNVFNTKFSVNTNETKFKQVTHNTKFHIEI